MDIIIICDIRENFYRKCDPTWDLVTLGENVYFFSILVALSCGEDHL